MAKIWVLDTETKGTGAEVVPLAKPREPSAPRFWPPFALEPPAQGPERPAGPALREPRRLRIVDVMTRELLADDVDLAAALEILKGVRSIVDVNVYVDNGADWRLLTLDEQRAVWRFRNRAATGDSVESGSRS